MSLVKQSDTTLAAQSSLPQGLAITQDVRMRQAQAETMARYQMAFMLPRSWDGVQAKLLLACSNPDFAREAYYRKPAGAGKFIEGLGIRFAELALQIMRNISIDTSPEMEDEFSAHYRMVIMDLESNTPVSETFKVEKTVERRGVKEGDTVISERTNSSGEKTYLIPATEDQFNTKLRAQMAKVKRTLVLSLVPAEVRAECLVRCKEVANSNDAKDPAAATKSIVAAFIGIGIDVPDLKEYLGKSPASATPLQVEELRGIFALIRDGELTWAEVMGAKRERDTNKGSAAAFVDQKQKDREKRKAEKDKEKATRAATQSATGAAAPKRGRGATAAPAADGPDTTAAQAAAEPKPDAPAPRARASRRGDDDESDTTDPASNSTPA